MLKKMRIVANQIQQPMYYNTPSCCGSALIHFPDKITLPKMSEMCQKFQSSGMMNIVFTKTLPKNVKKIHDGIGLIKYNRRQSAACMLLGFRCSTCEGRYFDRSGRIQISRMRKNIFFMHGLYGVQQRTLTKLLKELKKGDVLLAISAGHQPEEKKLLIKNDMKVVYSKVNPNSGYRISLHMFVK